MKQLTSAQDAIRQAIEGGWEVANYMPAFPADPKKFYDNEKAVLRFLAHIHERIFLNPLFWQALGKTRNWERQLSDNSISVWRYWAQEWFHVRMVGGDETAFWKSLP